jgi:hypothetical protein
MLLSFGEEAAGTLEEFPEALFRQRFLSSFRMRTK